jgi:hypothetical protein
MARTRTFKLSVGLLVVIVVLFAITTCAQVNADAVDSQEQTQATRHLRRQLQEGGGIGDDISKFFTGVVQDIEDIINNDPILFGGIVAGSIALGCFICFCCC